jgi:hypothetical protein
VASPAYGNADLVMIARLGQTLVRARAMPLAA